MSRAAGISDAKFRDLARYRESDAFSPLERSVLDYATAVCSSAVDVPEATFDELREQLTPGQILELTHNILRSADRARLNRAFDQAAERIPDEGYCLVREAREHTD